MNPFPLPLHYDNAGFVNGRRRIITTTPFRAVTSLGIINVPIGTISDGSSIPKVAWSIIGSPMDEYLEDAVVHDFLYSKRNDNYTREEADFLFKETMWNHGVNKAKLIAMWAAVRLCGRGSFKAKIPNI